MQLFIRQILSDMIKEIYEIHKPERYKIDYSVLIKTQKIVLQQLGFSNINQLRDRFEGQKYLNSVLLKTYAFASLQLSFENEINHRELLEQIKTNSITLDSENYEIIISDMDSLPMVPKSELNSAILIFVNIATRDALIVGKASFKAILDNLDRAPISPVYEKYYHGYLKNFKIFSPLREQIDEIR